MLNLTNNQLKYLAYGSIGLILIVLLLNIFLTKINNNYNNSTFESFGNISEGMENKKVKPNLDKIKKNMYKSLDIPTIKELMCGNKEWLKDYSEAFKEDIPKIQGFMVYLLMLYSIELSNPKNSDKDIDNITKEISKIKESINTFNVINDNMHYIDQVCQSSITDFSGDEKKFSDKSNSSSKKSWF